MKDLKPIENDKLKPKDYERELIEKNLVIEKLKEEIEILKKSIGIFTKTTYQK